MVFSIKPGIPGIATCRFRWLQIAACAVLAWGCLQGGPARMLPLGPSAPPLTEEAAAGTTAPEVANGASTLSTTGQSSAPQQLESASFGLSTVEVIVYRNDTLDRIFRRLKLSLADLASLRSLPGLKARLDSLRPGESLRLSHRDGALFGLERRLNEEQTLKVSRDAAGLRADVLQNPLDARPRIIRASINSSLFEAVEAAGSHD